MTPKKISLLGVPCGVGAGEWGCSHGPEALFSRHGLKDQLTSLGHDVETFLLSLHEPSLDYFQSGFHHKKTVLSWCQRLQQETLSVLAKNQFPLIVGGDHSIAMGSLSAVAQHCQESRHSLTVIWLDAHGDFNTPETSETGHIHGMPLASLCGYGDTDFISLIGEKGLLDSHDVHLLGVRDLDSQEAKLLQSSRINLYSAEELANQGYGNVMRAILDDVRLKPSPYVHLSFDLDFMDASLAQGTGTPVEKGPGLIEVEELFDCLQQSGLMRSMDIVEFNPMLEGSHHTAEALSHLLKSLFSIG